MSFKTGTLARPVRVVKPGPDVVLEASFAWQGPFERVFVKLANENRRCIEAVCAWIAQDAGLPCPEPRFVQVARGKMPRDVAWPFGESTNLAFCTVAIPNARQLAKLDSGWAADQLGKWPWLEVAGVFDELIANDDRSNGNVLLDGRASMWLIDHGRALGGGGQRLFSTELFPPFKNYFLEMIAQEAMPKKLQRKNVLLSASYEMAARAPRVPYGDLMVPEPLALQISSILTRRAASLPAMVLEAARIPDLYDAGESSRSLQ